VHPDASGALVPARIEFRTNAYEPDTLERLTHDPLVLLRYTYIPIWDDSRGCLT
jgi:hypothetical protein